MFLEIRNKRRPVRDARDPSKHPFVVAALGGVVLMVVAGCPAAFPFGDLLPSEADVEAFNLQVASLPSMSVRIINETSASASVELQAGVAPFVDAFFGVPFPGEESFLQPVDSTTVVVASNGTLTGSITCGELIGVSALPNATSGSLLVDEAYLGENSGCSETV